MITEPDDSTKAEPASEDASREARYKGLFDRVPMALYLSAPDGAILDANPAMIELLGYPDRESLLKLNAYDIFVNRQDRISLVEQIEQADLIRGYEMQLRHYGGSLIWVLDHARAVRDSAGCVRFYEGALKDITARKLAQEELRETNEKLRAVIENSPLAIVSVDIEGNVVSWNPAAERIFGWREDEVVGHPPSFVPAGKQHEFRSLWNRVLQGEQLEEIELQRQKRDGTPIHVSLSAGPLYDPAGSVVGVVGVLADITERKRAEETRRRLVEILEATPDLVGVSTIDGRGIYLNPAGRRMLGVDAGEQNWDKPIWEYHAEPHKSMIRNVVMPAAIRDGTWVGEIAFKSRDEAEIPTSLVMIAHRTAEGEVDHFSTVARDLSAQKALEERLRQAQTMDAIGRLAGGIAHDFNNLLTAIIGNADLLLRNLDDEQDRADAKAIQDAGQRAAALTSQLLAFGRRKVMQVMELDLNGVIAGLGSRLKEMFGTDIELVTVLDGTLGCVKADPVQLEETIAALVENACEAMPDGGRLNIETAPAEFASDEALRLALPQPGRYAALSITDTGVGMDEETQSRIFEPFFSTKKEVKGTGLGLATVYGIVKQSGGAITVDSAPGRGTTVRVYLPVAEDVTDGARIGGASP